MMMTEVHSLEMQNVEIELRCLPLYHQKLRNIVDRGVLSTMMLNPQTFASPVSPIPKGPGITSDYACLGEAIMHTRSRELATKVDIRSNAKALTSGITSSLGVKL